MRYRTEISIPPDRYVCVQLPAYLPEGRAQITITFHESEGSENHYSGESDLDRQDIEWWDEFDENLPAPV